jgi:hypothetical protein
VPILQAAMLMQTGTIIQVLRLKLSIPLGQHCYKYREPGTPPSRAIALSVEEILGARPCSSVKNITSR